MLTPAKDSRTVYARFTGAIALAFLATAFVAFVLRPNICPQSVDDEWTARGHSQPRTQDHDADYGGKITLEKKRPHHGHGSSSDKQYENFEEIVCGEIKIGDIGLVLFTLALVIATWFLMVSTEETTRRAERAYLVPGPFFGTPRRRNFADDVSKWTMENRAIKNMFQGPWRMSVTNFGRTAAYSTEIVWGLCPLSNFPLNIKVSELLNSQERERKEWRETWIRGHAFPENIFGERDSAFQIRFVEIEDRDAYIGWVHFGRIRYKDVFKEPHFACFAYYILEEYSTAIGRSISEDHD